MRGCAPARRISFAASDGSAHGATTTERSLSSNVSHVSMFQSFAARHTAAAKYGLRCVANWPTSCRRRQRAYP